MTKLTREGEKTSMLSRVAPPFSENDVHPPDIVVAGGKHDVRGADDQVIEPITVYVPAEETLRPEGARQTGRL